VLRRGCGCRVGNRARYNVCAVCVYMQSSQLRVCLSQLPVWTRRNHWKNLSQTAAPRGCVTGKRARRECFPRLRSPTCSVSSSHASPSREPSTRHDLRYELGVSKCYTKTRGAHVTRSYERGQTGERPASRPRTFLGVQFRP
jgi:hypothetical protein